MPEMNKFKLCLFASIAGKVFNILILNPISVIAVRSLRRQSGPVLRVICSVETAWTLSWWSRGCSRTGSSAASRGSRTTCCVRKRGSQRAASSLMLVVTWGTESEHSMHHYYKLLFSDLPPTRLISLRILWISGRTPSRPTKTTMLLRLRRQMIYHLNLPAAAAISQRRERITTTSISTKNVLLRTHPLWWKKNFWSQRHLRSLYTR